MVYLAIHAWKLAWAVCVCHLTISHPQLLEISRWQPFFKMATTRVANSLKNKYWDTSLAGPADPIAFTLPGGVNFSLFFWVQTFFSPYLNEFHSGENVMQCPIRCPYNGLNLAFPYGCPSNWKGAINEVPSMPPTSQCPKGCPFQ